MRTTNRDVMFQVGKTVNNAYVQIIIFSLRGYTEVKNDAAIKNTNMHRTGINE